LIQQVAFPQFLSSGSLKMSVLTRSAVLILTSKTEMDSPKIKRETDRQRESSVCLAFLRRPGCGPKSKLWNPFRVIIFLYALRGTCLYVLDHPSSLPVLLALLTLTSLPPSLPPRPFISRQNNYLMKIISYQICLVFFLRIL
jgi:hypothetical protein